MKRAHTMTALLRVRGRYVVARRGGATRSGTPYRRGRVFLAIGEMGGGEWIPVIGPGGGDFVHASAFDRGGPGLESLPLTRPVRRDAPLSFFAKDELSNAIPIRAKPLESDRDELLPPC